MGSPTKGAAGYRPSGVVTVALAWMRGLVLVAQGCFSSKVIRVLPELAEVGHGVGRRASGQSYRGGYGGSEKSLRNSLFCLLWQRTGSTIITVQFPAPPNMLGDRRPVRSVRCFRAMPEDNLGPEA